MDKSAHCCNSRSRSIKPASEALPPGTGMPAALWGDEGGVPRRAEPLLLNYRRGQRLPTDIWHTPAPARSAGLRFAVILLSKAPDVGRDHLIHRKRSPFPYEGKDLTPPKLGLTLHVGRATSRFRMFLVSAQTLREGERVCRSPHPEPHPIW